MSVRDGYDRTVQALDLKDEDAALVALGETLADTLDAAAQMSGEAKTKALYLTPHLMNVLKEMLATPAARKAATKPGAPPAEKGAGRGDTLGKLRGITGGKSA
jgi:Asp-tRNA(Asn)/Glu-tRNA(Gln) amidotransferase B subunit